MPSGKRYLPGTVTPGHLLLFLALLILSILAGLWSLSQGSMDISWRSIAAAISSTDTGIELQVVRDLRMPRILSGYIVGGLLALAGVLMQVLLRNPLAEPFVLGISGGAAVFALLAIVAGIAGTWINIGAFTGALISMLMVFGLTRLSHGWNPMRVLLTGIVIAAGWGALINFLLVMSPSSQLYSMLFWLMGDLSFARFSVLAAVTLLAGTVIAMLMARSLNLLALGENQAAVLGVDVGRLRYLLYFLASVLTAAAVMQAGSIGFIGLIVPHMLRLALGADHRLLIPFSVLAGGCLLVIADCLARTIIAPQQLPVGVLTAFIGVPMFLFLLLSPTGGRR